LLAIVFILWIRIALRDACTTTSPALGARRAATQEAVDMDSNASRAGEVERKVWWDNDFLLPGKLLKMSPLVDGRSCPKGWCKSGGVFALSGGFRRFDQAATAGSLKIGSSLNGAMVSRVM
jgi:hypothetical protein